MKIEVAGNKQLDSTKTKNTSQKTSSKADEKKDAAKTSTPVVSEKTKSAKIPKAAPLEEPAYVVAVSQREMTEKEKANAKGYSPQELRSKAKAFLESGSMSPEQREIFAKVLSAEEPTKKIEK